MALRLSEDPFLNGCWAPWPMEGEIRNATVIQGEIPRELRGTLFRNGANQRFTPRGKYHPFDGDGMIHAFRFEDGRVDYRNRWVRTEKFALEDRHGEALFGGLANLGANDPRAEGTSFNLANTNVVHHGGKLLALWEAGAPTALDSETLATEGIWSFDGALVRNGAPGPLTAHPRFDPKTGEMLAFAYSMLPPHCVYHRIDASGRLVHSEEIPVPYPSMMHDFIATERFAIFPVLPATFRAERIAEQGTPMGWEPDLPALFAVLPREGGADAIRWFEVETCFVFHFLNAWDDGDEIVIDGSRFARLPEASESGEADATYDPARLWRFRLDLASGSVKETPLTDLGTDFPRPDERFSCRRHRHAYGAVTSGRDAASAGFSGLFHFDLGQDRQTVRELAPGDTTSEAVFVPLRDDTDEGDGILMAVIHRGAEDRSDLLLLDGRDVAGEPIATIGFPHRIPMGFHGNWAAGV